MKIIIYLLITIYLITCNCNFIDYDKINNDIQILIEKFKTINNWNELLQLSTTTTTKLKNNIEKVFNPFIDKVIYFEKPILLIHYIKENRNLTIIDTQKIFKSYLQSIDTFNKYLYIHWIPYYKPWPSNIINDIQTIDDLLPKNNYLLIDLSDFDEFKNRMNKSYYTHEILYDRDGDIRGDILLCIAKVLYNNYFMNYYNNQFNIPDLIYNSYKYFKSDIISYNNTLQYWLLDISIDWVGNLPKVLQRFNQFDDSFIGISITTNTTSNIPNYIDILDSIMKSMDSIRLICNNDILCYNKQISNFIYNSKSIINIIQYSKRIYRNDIIRISDSLLYQIIAYISNTTTIWPHDDSSFSNYIAKLYSYSIHDVKYTGINDNLLSTQFQNDNNTIDSCDEYYVYDKIFKSDDLDIINNQRGRIFINITKYC